MNFSCCAASYELWQNVLPHLQALGSDDSRCWYGPPGAWIPFEIDKIQYCATRPLRGEFS